MTENPAEEVQISETLGKDPETWTEEEFEALLLHYRSLNDKWEATEAKKKAKKDAPPSTDLSSITKGKSFADIK
jgi:hypothetical protein